MYRLMELTLTESFSMSLSEDLLFQGGEVSQQYLHV